MSTSDKIFGYDWGEIKTLQQKGKINRIIMTTSGDYGADPLGDGKFKMVPSGDIVDLDERNKRLNKATQPA